VAGKQKVGYLQVREGCSVLLKESTGIKAFAAALRRKMELASVLEFE